MSGISDIALRSALKGCFNEDDDKDKTMPEIRKRIKRHVQEPAIAALIESSDLDAVSTRTHQLLSSRAFNTARTSQTQSGSPSNTKPSKTHNPPETVQAGRSGLNAPQPTLSNKTTTAAIPSSMSIINAPSSSNAGKGN